VRVDRHAPLAPLTTLELGGPARDLVKIESLAVFPDLVAYANTHRTIPRVIGSGSNILVADDGYDGLIVHMATTGVGIRSSESDNRSVLVTVQAGHELQSLVDQSIDDGLTGIEFLTGIPGTVGATPIQNVGAYGQEVAEVLVSVDAWDWWTNRSVKLTAADCAFGHRTSAFKRSSRWTILAVTFALARSRLSAVLSYRAVAQAAGASVGDRVSLAEAAAAVRDVRRKKGMILDPEDPDRRSVGSVFPSTVVSQAMAERLRADGAPVNDFPDGSTRVSASWLIKEAAFSLGQQLAPGVRISGKHYTLVADEGASAAAFADASALVATRVHVTTGVKLIAEPDLIGRLPTYESLMTNDPSGDSLNSE